MLELDDTPIDFSIGAMHPKTYPLKAGKLTTDGHTIPLVATRPSAFCPAEIRAVCEGRGIPVSAEPRRMETRPGTIAIEWSVGDLVIREHDRGALWIGEGADRRMLLHDRASLPLAPKPVALVPRCPQCGFAYGIAGHTRIVRRNRCDEEMTFCSVACGDHFQMGCEG